MTAETLKTDEGNRFFSPWLASGALYLQVPQDLASSLAWSKYASGPSSAHT